MGELGQIGPHATRPGRNRYSFVRCVLPYSGGQIMSVNLKSLIGKLNDTTRSALEGAAGLCLSRTHYDVEVEHYLLKLMETSDADLARIIKGFGIDKSRLSLDLS